MKGTQRGYVEWPTGDVPDPMQGAERGENDPEERGVLTAPARSCQHPPPGADGALATGHFVRFHGARRQQDRQRTAVGIDFADDAGCSAVRIAAGRWLRHAVLRRCASDVGVADVDGAQRFLAGIPDFLPSGGQRSAERFLPAGVEAGG